MRALIGLGPNIDPVRWQSLILNALDSGDQFITVYSTGRDLIRAARKDPPHLIILDADLPDAAYTATIHALRAHWIEAPIFVIEADYCSDAIARGLMAGADRVLKPRETDREVIAQLKAVWRLAHRHLELRSVVRVGEISVDFDASIIYARGKRVLFTNRELVLMMALARRPGAPMSKHALLESVYQGIDVAEMKIIDVYICKIRKKLDALGCPGYIETVWGQGYRLQDPGEHDGRLVG